MSTPGSTPTRADTGDDPRRTTVVHLLRHGEVNNPQGVLYGRLPDYHLTTQGMQMAERVAQTLADHELTHLVSSPLERAQETARPIAERLGQEVTIDRRVIEAGNRFEGRAFGVGDGALRRPTTWWHLRNPWKPSWGEPFKGVVERMLAAMADARDAARGHEALVITHQLPIWITRSAVEGLPFLHDPRRRQCTLCSLTSFTYVDSEVVSVSYSEPASDLLPARGANAPFSAGA